MQCSVLSELGGFGRVEYADRHTNVFRVDLAWFYFKLLDVRIVVLCDIVTEDSL